MQCLTLSIRDIPLSRDIWLLRVSSYLLFVHSKHTLRVCNKSQLLYLSLPTEIDWGSLLLIKDFPICMHFEGYLA